MAIHVNFCSGFERHHHFSRGNLLASDKIILYSGPPVPPGELTMFVMMHKPCADCRLPYTACSCRPGEIEVLRRVEGSIAVATVCPHCGAANESLFQDLPEKS